MCYRETEKNVQSTIKSKNPFAVEEEPKIKYKKIISKSIDLSVDNLGFERHELTEIDEDDSIFF